ncbi:hypothetical protein AVDCRST_MAG94-1630 [uncultured Leptolyngbya sp.]|uniref:Uncharacterized protein n=1 Tax=uncultured Leptolyngbya sp. TaxID=332963 RepID=A0A6J4L8D2_9CYAN|nr:hypothetical protein AVDCRST_MAG94-1630 [uncultured Leptolyngbya sp.]
MIEPFNKQTMHFERKALDLLKTHGSSRLPPTASLDQNA